MISLFVTSLEPGGNTHDRCKKKREKKRKSGVTHVEDTDEDVQRVCGDKTESGAETMIT